MDSKLRQIISIFMVLTLVSLACNLSGETPTQLPPTETSPPIEITPENPTETIPPPTATQGSLPPTVTPEPPPTALEPGWHIYSNANFVNGIALHDGTLWAATLGGVVAWDLDSGEATKYTTLDGLGHISAYDIIICPVPALRVVVGTEAGLNFFDPVTGAWDTTPITPEEGHVATSQIKKLYCDEENDRLLIGYSGLGILDVNTGKWQHFTESEGLASNSVDDMIAIGENIWAVGYKGISVIGEEEITIITEAEGMLEEQAEALTVDSDGNIWLGSRSGLLRFLNGYWTLYDQTTVTDFPSGAISSVAVAPDGTVWVGSYKSGVCHFDPATETCLAFYEYESTQEAFIGGDRLTDLVVDEDGNIYYSNYGGGIQAFDGSRWKRLYLEDDHLASNFVTGFVQDGDGMLWIGTDNGVLRVDPADLDAGWEHFQAGEGGPPANAFWGLFPAPDGSIWFAHDNKRVSNYDGEGWTTYGPDQSVPGGVNAVAASADGSAWLGTDEGLTVIGGAFITVFTEADGLPNKNVRSLLVDGDTLWIGTTDGLARYQDGEIKVVLGSDDPGLPGDSISVIVKEADGSLLLGTSGGLARFDGAQATTLLEPEPISGLFGTPVQSITGIAIGEDGSLWVGTYAGLYHGDEQSWEHITTADGLPTNNINAVYVDHLGSVWVGGGYTDAGGGIARYLPSPD